MRKLSFWKKVVECSSCVFEIHHNIHMIFVFFGCFDLIILEREKFGSLCKCGRNFWRVNSDWPCSVIMTDFYSCKLGFECRLGAGLWLVWLVWLDHNNHRLPSLLTWRERKKNGHFGYILDQLECDTWTKTGPTDLTWLKRKWIIF
jgi:hypothetical protein